MHQRQHRLASLHYHPRNPTTFTAAIAGDYLFVSDLQCDLVGEFGRSVLLKLRVGSQRSWRSPPPLRCTPVHFFRFQGYGL